MSFRLVAKSATFNDLEQELWPLFCVISPNFRVRCRRETIILGLPRDQNLLLIFCDHINTICAIIQRLLWQNEKAMASTSDCSCLRPCLLMSLLQQQAGPLCSTAGWTGESTLKRGLMGRQVAQMLSKNQDVCSMGAGAGLYMYDVVVVRYLIS